MQSPGEIELLRPIIARFTAAQVAQIEPLGNGHIHQTYLVRLTAEAEAPLVLQRVNTHVFPKLDAVMQNIVRVTSHVRARLEREGARDLDRRILTLRLTVAGKTHHVDAERGAYRMFGYVAGSVTLDRLDAPQEAFEAGRAPRVVLRATHEGALDYCALADLKRHAIDLA